MIEPPARPARPRVVAIDGPSGTGKSSVARAVAGRLGYHYLDTGAMYRALTWWCLQKGIDLADTAAVAGAARRLPIQLGLASQPVTVAVDGREVEPLLRTSAISQVVSQVATNLDARAEMVRRQQHIIAEHAERGIVAEGRDITTVVAPDAPARILLVADEAARLSRRARQLHGTTDAKVLDRTRDEVVRRDVEDSAVAEFFTAAPGVVVVDSSRLSLVETIGRVLGIVQAALPAVEQHR